jgi:hypothetical protein
MLRIKVPMWSKTLAHDIGYAGSYGDFYPLQGIHDQNSELSVCDVKTQNIIKSGVRVEPVFLRLKGDIICGEAIIADGLQIALCPGDVRDDQSPVFQQFDLLRYGQGWFAELFHGFSPKKITYRPRFRVLPMKPWRTVGIIQVQKYVFNRALGDCQLV